MRSRILAMPIHVLEICSSVSFRKLAEHGQQGHRYRGQDRRDDRDPGHDPGK